MSYSQNNEESYIISACPPVGRLLEIGAWHATDKSNSRALIERGWSGVLVEPSPLPFAGLEAEYGDEPRITLINAAVWLGAEPTIRMYVTADAVSTTQPAIYNKWKDHVKYTDEVLVPTISLERIYSDHGDFDFVSVDCEGISVDVLHHLMEMGKRPRCLCVEHDERTTELLSTVTPLGYAAVYVSGENIVLVRQC